MMLLALVLLNIIYPGRIMPGKECDFPSRKQRKAEGKNNVKGRAGQSGGALPLYDTARVSSLGEGVRLNPTYPKIGEETRTVGYVTEFER